MISLPCTSCKKVLEIDDAFAGGVCRCQHCGTIQTVPAKNKSAARAGAPPKALYEKQKKTAETNASIASALSSAPVAVAKVRAAQPATPSAPRPRWQIFAAAGVGALILILVLIWLF